MSMGVSDENKPVFSAFCIHVKTSSCILFDVSDVVC
jgi:hypothetical protein